MAKRPRCYARRPYWDWLTLEGWSYLAVGFFAVALLAAAAVVR